MPGTRVVSLIGAGAMAFTPAMAAAGADGASGRIAAGDRSGTSRPSFGAGANSAGASAA